MAYYSKEEVLNYVDSSIKEIEKKGVKPLNTREEVVMRLENEEDMAGFFWIEYISEEDQNSEDEKNVSVSMGGRAFVRVDHDIYTDDRFAIDLYESAKKGCTVSDVINKREEDKELAKQGIVDQTALEEKIKENTDKNGAE